MSGIDPKNVKIGQPVPKLHIILNRLINFQFFWLYSLKTIILHHSTHPSDFIQTLQLQRLGPSDITVHTIVYKAKKVENAIN